MLSPCNPVVHILIIHNTVVRNAILCNAYCPLRILFAAPFLVLPSLATPFWAMPILCGPIVGNARQRWLHSQQRHLWKRPLSVTIFPAAPSSATPSSVINILSRHFIAGNTIVCNAILCDTPRPRYLCRQSTSSTAHVVCGPILGNAHR